LFFYGYYLDMFKNLNCVIDLIITDSLVIFEIRNSKFDLKENLVNNYKKNDELHIILKRINLEICEHSSFFNYSID